jgi:hypothetical protein
LKEESSRLLLLIFFLKCQFLDVPYPTTAIASHIVSQLKEF